MQSSLSSLRVAAVVSALVPFSCTAARAQDPGMDAAMQANQMAMQAAQQANQQAIQNMQLASQLANQQMINNLQTDNWWATAPARKSTNPLVTSVFRTAAPRLSKKPGAFSAAIAVRLKDRTQGAEIYYTTDGWTPTRASTRYAGPITISSTTTLQAVAIAPNFVRSIVKSATYVFPATTGAQGSDSTLPVHTGADGVLILASDSPIPLIFAQPLSSGTAQAGEHVAFTVAEDMKSGETIVIPKGTPATGSVVRAVRAQPGVDPGRVAFRIDSLTLRGRTIPLHRVAVREGAIDPTAEDAQIAAGTAVTASIPAGTILPMP